MRNRKKSPKNSGGAHKSARNSTPKQHNNPKVKPQGRPQPQSQSKPRLNASLYGQHAVQEAWRNPMRKIKALYITENALEGFDLNVSHDTARPQPAIIDKKDLDNTFPQGAVHQGVALDCADLPEMDVNDLIITTRDQEKSVIVMLDQVTDPHNVGAIIRSCSAFGADGIIMQRRHAPELTGVLAKTACGGVEHINVAYETNLSRTLEGLQEAGYFVYGLDERGDRSIGEINTNGKSVIVLGAEGSGLRRLVAEHCDELIKLPTQPPIASLNVSNAAAVALYALLG